MEDKVSPAPEDAENVTEGEALPQVTEENGAAEVAQTDGAPLPEDAAQGKKQPKKYKKKRNLWAIKITIVTLFLSAFISYLTEITSSAGNIAVTVILLLFIVLAGIIADGIGVAVTSCDITPIVSMASKKEYGAKTAMWLVKNNEKVSNVCNDVIGDIISIISGSCGTVIVIAITVNLDESWQQWLSIAVSAVISAVMVGGKAFLKNIAISNSTCLWRRSSQSSIPRSAGAGSIRRKRRKSTRALPHRMTEPTPMQRAPRAQKAARVQRAAGKRKRSL